MWAKMNKIVYNGVGPHFSPLRENIYNNIVYNIHMHPHGLLWECGGLEPHFCLLRQCANLLHQIPHKKDAVRPLTLLELLHLSILFLYFVLYIGIFL